MDENWPEMSTDSLKQQPRTSMIEETPWRVLERRCRVKKTTLTWNNVMLD